MTHGYLSPGPLGGSQNPESRLDVNAVDVCLFFNTLNHSTLSSLGFSGGSGLPLWEIGCGPD